MLYKLRLKSGLYATGGYSSVGGPIGKIWKSLGNLKSHMRLFRRWTNKDPYDGLAERILQRYGGATVEEYAAVPVREIPIEQFLKEAGLA